MITFGACYFGNCVFNNVIALSQFYKYGFLVCLKSWLFRMTLFFFILLKLSAGHAFCDTSCITVSWINTRLACTREREKVFTFLFALLCSFFYLVRLHVLLFIPFPPFFSIFLCHSTQFSCSNSHQPESFQCHGYNSIKNVCFLNL